MQKRILDVQRLRQIPRQFSWVDQRLTRNHLLEKSSAPSWGLYLLLVTVGDQQGLSYYSDRSIQRYLSLSEVELNQCREELQRHGFIAYEAPLYQVLDLEMHCGTRVPPPWPVGLRQEDGQSRSIGEVLQKMMGGVQ